MANPILNDKAFEQATAAASGADAALPPPAPGTQAGPISDGPISPYRSYRPMTLDGTIAQRPPLRPPPRLGDLGMEPGRGHDDEAGQRRHQLPELEHHRRPLRVRRRPRLVQAVRAKFLAPVYAIAEGVFVGAISAAYNAEWDGIVVQAVGPRSACSS